MRKLVTLKIHPNGLEDGDNVPLANINIHEVGENGYEVTILLRDKWVDPLGKALEALQHTLNTLY